MFLSSTPNSVQFSFPSKIAFVVHRFVLAFYKNSNDIRGGNHFLSTFLAKTQINSNSMSRNFAITILVGRFLHTGRCRLSRIIDAAFLIYIQLTSNCFDYSICWTEQNDRRTNFPLQFSCTYTGVLSQYWKQNKQTVTWINNDRQ